MKIIEQLVQKKGLPEKIKLLHRDALPTAKKRLKEKHPRFNWKRYRKEEDRYSMQVSMERIEKEGYNLNISRYISTAIAEEEVVLQATHAKLGSLAQKIETATGKHNDFLKELGLPPLP